MHLHTAFSDGTFTPEDLIKEAKRAGLAAISVVDHDTVDAMPFVSEIAEKNGIELIPGIELSCQHENSEIHLLGYFIDYKNKGLIEKLDVFKKTRVERVYRIIEKLKELGLDLRPETVFGITNKASSISRLHIARAMVKDGLVASIEEAFRKYIGDKSPAHVLGFKLSPREAINLVKEFGGIPVLAHPYTIRDDTVLSGIIEAGIMGLEIYYPEHSQSLINFYLQLAKEKDLLVTGGSDCHGTVKPEVKMGIIKLPYEFVEKLKAARK